MSYTEGLSVVLLLGGKGLRFREKGYVRPKPMINIAGKPMVRWLVDGLCLRPEDRLYALYHRDMAQFGFEELMPPQCHNIKITADTRGPVETLLCLLNRLSPDELQRPFLTLDGDTFYESDILSLFRARCPDHHVIFYHEQPSRPACFSYLDLNSEGVVQNVVEKQPISTHANTGAYGFRSGGELQRAAEHVLGARETVLNEFYMTSIYRHFLQCEGPGTILGVDIGRHHPIGTPSQLVTFFRYINHRESAQPMRICFDLDGTLVTEPDISGDYSTVKPLSDNVTICNALHKAGHTIIVYTARRMRTHSANMGRVIRDIGKVTLDTLDRFGILYDEIYFGKPYADYYVDDKAINPAFGLSKEIGVYDDTLRVNEVPADGTVACRHFHVVTMGEHTVTKMGPCDSLAGELHWYQAVDKLPMDLRSVFPQLLSSEIEVATDKSTLSLARKSGITFSHLLTNCGLTSADLSRLLELLHRLHDVHVEPPAHYDPQANYSQKLQQRMEQHCALYVSVLTDHRDPARVAKLKQWLEHYTYDPQTTIHGDPVFTNVINGTENLWLIDMRGRQGSVLTQAGDANYDWAKVYQSLLGYDEIVLSAPTIPEVYRTRLLDTFGAYMTQLGVALTDLRYLTACHFLTLIPLHQFHHTEFAQKFRNLCDQTMSYP